MAVPSPSALRAFGRPAGSALSQVMSPRMSDGTSTENFTPQERSASSLQVPMRYAEPRHPPSTPPRESSLNVRDSNMDTSAAAVENYTPEKRRLYDEVAQLRQMVDCTRI